MAGAAPTHADFQRLYEAELDFVWSTLRRLGVGPAHLEDVAHDVFVVAWRKLAEYDPTRPVRPWLFGIAYRLASDYRSRAWQQREVNDEAADAPDERPGAEDVVAQRQARALVDRALVDMPLERRAVFLMHELEGLGIPEVAAALDVPLNTAYSRLRLARRDFAEAVERIQGGAP